MRQSKFIFCLILLVAVSSSYAQTDINRIKSDPKYWCAEGQGTTIDEADHDALAQIIRQISVSISANTQETNESGKKDNGVEYSSYTQKGTINSSSFVSLKNVEMLIVKPEPDAVVFRWVAKSEVDKMFEERKAKILDFIETGRIAEQRLQIDDALRNYYWALMLSKAHRDAVYCDFGGKSVNCLTFLPQKIKSVISHVKATLEECTYSENRYKAGVKFTYDGRETASIQLRYFDGQSFIGPLTARNGYGELDLVALPADGKLKIRYEYSFRNEAENLDAELRSVFSETGTVPIDNAMTEIPVKINQKKNAMTMDNKKSVSSVATNDVAADGIKPEAATKRERKPLEMADDNTRYLAVLNEVEEAIRRKTPQTVFSLFTPDGYKMFETLLRKTGTVTLVGGNQKYEFVKANGQILGRFCKVKIRFKDGKSFMENLVFRFNETDGKIQSVAFALTQKAEDDIFNAASSWTDISRFTILQFMEDYQTAYALKRLDYIEKIFSDDAIIITGTVLKTAPQVKMEGVALDMGRKDVHFTKQNKQQYMTNLRRHFNDREYIHLTFEDNITKVINAPRIQPGTAFAIQISQMYNSPVYSDKGYLTLVLDASKELPIIHVRMWQPDKKEMMTIEDFINKFEF